MKALQRGLDKNADQFEHITSLNLMRDQEIREANRTQNEMRAHFNAADNELRKTINELEFEIRDHTRGCELTVAKN